MPVGSRRHQLEIGAGHKRVGFAAGDDQSAQLTAARQSAEASVKEAKTRIGQEASQAKADLAANSQLLADQITSAILQRRPA